MMTVWRRLDVIARRMVWRRVLTIDLSQSGPLNFDSGDTALRVRSGPQGHITCGASPPPSPAAAGNSCPTRCTGNAGGA